MRLFNLIATRFKLTIVALLNLVFVFRNNQKIPVTIVIEYDETQLFRINECKNSGKIQLMKMFTDECARHCVKNKIGKNIVIMNFASRIHPDGSYITGALTQEEQLCRVIPHLYFSLRQKVYPYGKNTILITPNIQIMRNGSNYKLLDEPIIVSVVSCAAPDLNKESFDIQRIEQTLKNVFVNVKQTLPKTDTLILGAFGCGAFKNDPIIMSRTMKKIKNTYGELYENIIFAIPSGENYDIFKNYLIDLSNVDLSNID